MENKKDSVFQDFWNSIQYYIDSKKGKYSLETYLQIISEYTDELIKDAERKGFLYKGGKCGVWKNDKSEMLEFHIEMYFENRDREVIEKEAERQLSIKKFTREAVATIGDKGLKFNIERPKEEN